MQLTALEFKLLGTLYDRRDRVQTRGSLLEDVWGASAEMATRTVDTHVKRLREKLGTAGDYIETVRGVGYRFVARPERAHLRRRAPRPAPCGRGCRGPRSANPGEQQRQDQRQLESRQEPGRPTPAATASACYVRNSVHSGSSLACQRQR